jgi:hypothetical protein
LSIFDRALRLAQRRDRPPNYLERQLGQTENLPQAPEYALAVIVWIKEAAIAIRKDECFGRRVRNR